MKIQYYTASSLDGFIAAFNNLLEWLLQFGEPEAVEGGSYSDFILQVGDSDFADLRYEVPRAR